LDPGPLGPGSLGAICVLGFSNVLEGSGGNCKVLDDFARLLRILEAPGSVWILMDINGYRWNSMEINEKS